MSQYTSGSTEFAAAVTTSDTTVLTPFQRLYIGGAGAVAIRDLGGNVVTFAAVPVGTVLPVRGDKVMATNTTATNIVAMY